MPDQDRRLNIAAWVASGLLFALYSVVASPPKLMSAQQAVEGFQKVGYSDGFRVFIGTCEFLGGIALLIPRLAFWSAIGLSVIMLGAVYTHLANNDAVHVAPAIVALLILGFIARVRRRQALFLS